MKMRLIALTVIASVSLAQGIAFSKKPPKSKNAQRKQQIAKTQNPPSADTQTDPSIMGPPHDSPIKGPFPIYQEKK